MFKQTQIALAVLTALSGGMLLAATGAYAQSSTPPSPTSPPTESLQRVEITGSSIKRIDAETALPVQVITREQIEKTGATNVEQLLQTISSISSSGGLTTASASGATTGGISAVSLHGLTSLRTLVLLNGRRVAPYGVGFTGDSVSVDVNSIPLAAIERVEVLKDGASAIYGSDAIAGVINFILRQEFKGVELTGEYGDTTQGGANFKRATGTFGYGSLAEDRFNVMLVASYQKEGSLFGSDRSFASTSIQPGIGNDTTSGNTFPGNIVTYNPVTGQLGGASRNPTAPACPGPYAINDPLFPSNRCRFDTAPLVTLVPASERASAFVTGKFAITPDIQAYAEGSFNRNTIRTIIQPVPLSDQFALPSNNPLCAQAPYNNTSSGPCQAAIIIYPTSPFYPSAYATSQFGANPPLAVRYRAAVNGNRDITDISEAPRFVVGVKGSALGFDFDLAALHSESKVREQDNAGYPIYSQVLPLLNSGTVNLFGPNTPAVDAQIQATNYTGNAFSVKSQLSSIAGKASRDIYTLPAGPIAVALGTELRREQYNYSSASVIQTGDVSGYGGNFLPVDKARNVYAGFVETNIPIVKNLELDAAVRYDHYQNVGNSYTPKGSIRWQPTPQVLLRTSYGRGFRAPSLADLYSPNTQGVTPNGVSDPLRCAPPLTTAPPGGNSSTDCLTQFATTNGGNANLKPEKSKNFTMGVVFEPTSNVTVGLDYFRVILGNTITNGVNAADILANPNNFPGLVTRGAPDPAAPGFPGHITNIDQTNINLGTTKVTGLDLDARIRIPTTQWGRFTIAGSGTYFKQFDSSNLDGTYTGGVDQINSATNGLIPRYKIYMSVDWTRGPFSVTVAQNYQGGYHDFDANVSGNSRDVGSYTTYDLQGTYQAFKQWKMTVGVRNVLDRDPPYTNSAGGSTFQAGYDPEYADPRGRFVYGRVTYSF